MLSHLTGTVDRVEVLGDLTPAQREAVVSTASPLCILAGAGSGKTRVLTRRIAYRLETGTADPRHVLALTFTRRAAAELGTRLRALGVKDRVTAGTFHAVALAQLRQRWADRGEPAPAVLPRKGRLVASILAGRREVGGHDGAPAGGVGVAPVVAEIEWAQARLVTPECYREAVAGTRRRLPLPADDLAAIYARYQVEKRRRGLVDFDDLLGRLAAAIETDGEFAAVSRWRWRHLFVDEFQDLNPLQYRLLTAWLGPSRDLCAVGDPNQAIYSWNGADPSLLTEFAARYPAAEVIRLDTNHRSTPQVISASLAVLGGAGGGAVSTASTVAACSRPEGPPVTVQCYPTEFGEARGVAAALRLRHGPGVAWSQLSVLARTNAQLTIVQRALQAAGIPSRLPGGNLLDRPEIASALASLAGPGAAGSTSGGPRLAAVLPDLAVAADGGVVAADGADGADGERAAERRQSLALLADLGREFVHLDPSGSVAGFEAWLATSFTADRGVDAGSGTDAVTLSTFHRAKGLEWPVVYLMGLEDGLVPLGQDVEEERRLLYVALTRAEREVHCSWAARRSFGSRPVPRQPSPWLAAIESTIAGAVISRLPERGGLPPELRAARERLRRLGKDTAGPGSGGSDVSGTGPDVLVALHEWRRHAARAAQVAPYVVCHDATLAALAAARPANASELLAVPGLGPVKAARYGEALLALVARHGRTA